MTVETILAWMLALQAPGLSAYSAVAERPEVTCHTAWTPGCRIETAEEGAARYYVIAQAVAGIEGDDLQRSVLTVLYHESGFRRDVHSGRGRWARGDQGRSWCLGQVLLGRESDRGAKLTGLGAEPTGRCVAAVASRLRSVAQQSAYARFARYGGVWCSQDRRILARVRTYDRLRGPAPELADVVRRALGLELES